MSDRSVGVGVSAGGIDDVDRRRTSGLRTMAALAGATVFWGVSFVATKIALVGMHPILLIFSRFVCAAVFFVAAFRIRGFPRVSLRRHVRLIALAVFQPILYFAFETAGLRRISAAEVSLVIGTIPVGVILLARVFLSERVTKRKAVGAMLSVIGVVVLVLGDADLSTGLGGGFEGYLYSLGAVVAASLYMVLTRDLSRTMDSFAITGFQFIYGAVLFVPVFAWEAAVGNGVGSIVAIPGASLLALAYLVVFATMGGFLCYNYGLSRAEASRASVYINGVPVVAALSAWFVLGERLTPVQFAGGAIVIAGIYVASIRFRQSSRKDAPGAVVNGAPAGAPAAAPADSPVRGGDEQRGSGSDEPPFLKLNDIAVLLGGRTVFERTNWTIRRGANWAVVGPNGSGKTTLVRALCGRLPVVRGRIDRGFDYTRPGAIGYVSFEQHVDALARELIYGRTRYFSEGTDGGPTCKDLVGGGRSRADDGDVRFALELLGIAGVRDRPLRKLSAGEMKRALIARALAGRPELLVLDEPCAALDHGAQRSLIAALGDLMKRRIQMIIVTHRPDELPLGVDGLLVVRDCAVAYCGPRSSPAAAEALRDVNPGTNNTGDPTDADTAKQVPALHSDRFASAGNGGGGVRTAAPRSAPIVSLRNVSVRYGSATVLKGLTWTVEAGERWAITGPNGSGKTTIVDLICSEHPQAYANDVRVFGTRRGEGTSIWDLRKRIGHVSPELQVGYRKRVSALEVVASGFFSSNGIYRRVDPGRLETALSALAAFGIEPLAERPFAALSFGEQRLILIARALVTAPELLLLDEPCQGLDAPNRERVNELVERAADGAQALICVSHRLDDVPRSVTRVLTLDGNGGASVSRLVR